MNNPITTYTSAQITQLLKDAGQPAFRSKQLIEWLYVKAAKSYNEMTNLPQALRDTFAEQHPLIRPEIIEKRVSKDGTRKYVLKLWDGEFVETVAIPSDASHERLTVCFSTQVGCPMACQFCATGHEGFTRNLGPGEIIDQILIAQEDCGRRVTNIVGMGQGEPFLNYDNVLDALHILNNPKGIAIGARKITVSTCGVLKGISQFAECPEQWTLAISLHAARQSVRDQIMPKVIHAPLPELKAELIEYVKKTDRRVTLEYLLMDGINDSDADLDALVEFTEGLHCHINFLPMNAVESSPYQPAKPTVIKKWLARFETLPAEATLRTSRGSDIDGACGQLKNSMLNN